MMKRMTLWLLMAAGMMTACSSQNNAVINGEKVKLEEPGIYAKMSTSMGDILLKLDRENAPLTVANFVALAEGGKPLPGLKEEYQGKKFYDGLTFHRVIPDFMIQGGDPDGTGMGGPGYKFQDETDNELTHDKGVISMANSGPNTNGSQFFITVAPTKQLDGSYNIFGKVLKGQSVADSISKVETGQRNKPVEPVTINTVEIIRQGSEAKNYDAVATFTEAQEAAEAARAAAEAEAQNKLEELKATAQKTESGLHYKVIEEGDGPKPEIGQKVNVHYAGYLMNGDLFDSSIKEVAQKHGKYDQRREPYNPFPVEVGPGARVIEGWKEGLQLMNVGDKYKLIIPPNLAYGPQGAGNGIIPPNAWLEFDVEMVSIAKEAQNPAQGQ